MAEVLFINSVTLKKNTVIDGSVDPDLLMQYISMAQTFHIQNYLGSKLYQRLQQGITDSDLTANEIILLNEYVQLTLVHFAASEYFSFARFNAAQGGVFQHQPDNTVIMSRNDVNDLVQKERSSAEYYAKRLVDYLAFNDGLYPEYLANVDNDITAQNKIWRTAGWYMK